MKRLSAATQGDDLIAEDSGRFVDFERVQTVENEIAFGAGYEEGRSECDVVKSAEIQISTIHNIEGSRFERQLIEKVNVVNLAVGNQDYGGNVAGQMQHRMQVDGSLVLS